MSGFHAIDLSRLPAPAVVEPLDYETILAAMKADLIGRAPELEPALALESEPMVKLLEVCAYRELLIRARVNDAARAVMLATATGADLDNLAALFGVTRFVRDPGDPAAAPPVPPTLESDAVFRARAQLALEGFSTAGPVGAYMFHALSAEVMVKDVFVDSPVPGEVRVTILSREGNGTPTAPVLAAVAAALNAQDVRPLCDLVNVQAATILTYAVDAAIEVFDGPDPALVLAAALAAVTAHVDAAHALGRDVTLSGLYAALHQPGVARVTLTSPAAEIVVAATEAAVCTGLTVVLA
ncbi:baseplate J/gp47 family protein [Albidovulum sp.]|uniref:baseplate assembly protein n=1 Tax=Albidovulum sp. TaxID=1872424 RepID=UPI0039B8CEBC